MILSKHLLTINFAFMGLFSAYAPISGMQAMQNIATRWSAMRPAAAMLTGIKPAFAKTFTRSFTANQYPHRGQMGRYQELVHTASQKVTFLLEPKILAELEGFLTAVRCDPPFLRDNIALVHSFYGLYPDLKVKLAEVQDIEEGYRVPSSTSEHYSYFVQGCDLLGLDPKKITLFVKYQGEQGTIGYGQSSLDRIFINQVRLNNLLQGTYKDEQERAAVASFMTRYVVFHELAHYYRAHSCSTAVALSIRLLQGLQSSMEADEFNKANPFVAQTLEHELEADSIAYALLCRIGQAKMLFRVMPGLQWLRDGEIKPEVTKKLIGDAIKQFGH